ncbi:MAG: DUF5752 family protein [Candidatus Woesearchaeota archaeon]
MKNEVNNENQLKNNLNYSKSNKSNKKNEKKSKSKNNKKNNKLMEIKIKDAKPEHYFILATGVPLKNIKELALALQTMDEWVFNHHVNEHRNDFSNWIKDIFNEDALAEELKEIKTIKETELKLLRYLVSKYL